MLSGTDGPSNGKFPDEFIQEPRDRWMKTQPAEIPARGEYAAPHETTDRNKPASRAGLCPTFLASPQHHLRHLHTLRLRHRAPECHLVLASNSSRMHLVRDYVADH
jgi:hypothetical protein